VWKCQEEGFACVSFKARALRERENGLRPGGSPKALAKTVILHRLNRNQTEGGSLLGSLLQKVCEESLPPPKVGSGPRRPMWGGAVTLLGECLRGRLSLASQVGGGPRRPMWGGTVTLLGECLRGRLSLASQVGGGPRRPMWGGAVTLLGECLRGRLAGASPRWAVVLGAQWCFILDAHSEGVKRPCGVYFVVYLATSKL
jgi:hypothetical protein